MPAGRPPKFKTAEEMQAVIENYFARCDRGEDIPTITGLALELGMTRASLCNYEDRDEFFDTIKSAKQKVELFLEKRLYESAVTGAIFNLKNNFGWKDKSEQELTGANGGPIAVSGVNVKLVG